MCGCYFVAEMLARFCVFMSPFAAFNKFIDHHEVFLDQCCIVSSIGVQ